MGAIVIRILLQTLHELLCDVAGADAMRTSRVVRGLIDEIDEAELRRSKEPLILRRIDDITFEITQANLAPDVILKLMPVREGRFRRLLGHLFLGRLSQNS